MRTLHKSGYKDPAVLNITGYTSVENYKQNKDGFTIFSLWDDPFRPGLRDFYNFGPLNQTINNKVMDWLVTDQMMIYAWQVMTNNECWIEQWPKDSETPWWHKGGESRWRPVFEPRRYKN